jgi:hypothetical protein
MLYDVFICHASEDKDSFVRPLAEKLREYHLEVWYDEFSLTIGDSLRESIDRGLLKSRYGIVVLSPNFFKKKWPQRELNGLVAREMSEENQVILPIWHNISAKRILKYSPPLADRKAVESIKGLDIVCKELLKKLRPEGSPLIVAREELIRFGLDPPVVTDEWWLDVVEASNRIPSGGIAPPQNTCWGRWTFPLPYWGSKGIERGTWLAWTAMQMQWEKEADERIITQITKPQKVLDFIDSRPGLKEICHLYPDILAVYAPQLTIKGFGGEFEEDFENMLKQSVRQIKRETTVQAKPDKLSSATRPVHLCSEEIALRHPTFGNYHSARIACNFVQGELFGPEVKYYEIFEYLIWFLSSNSSWLPKKIHDFLIDGMKEWSVWFSASDDYWLIDKKFAHELMDAKSYETFKFTDKERNSLLKWIEHALSVLHLKDDPIVILDKFLGLGVIEAYFDKHKKLRKINR